MAGIDQFRGALLGGACGDALGYPLQSFSVSRIQRRFGPFGLRTLVRDAKNGKLAPVSDNTQMVLATIDGILWADAKKLEILEGVYRGYMRWFYSQTGEERAADRRHGCAASRMKENSASSEKNSCTPAAIRRKGCFPPSQKTAAARRSSR